MALTGLASPPIDWRPFDMFRCLLPKAVLERQFASPEVFDVTRENADSHLGFGYGVHGCAGQALARLEGQAILTALASRVERFTIGEPVHALNNAIRALSSLPVTVTATV